MDLVVLKKELQALENGSGEIDEDGQNVESDIILIFTGNNFKIRYHRGVSGEGADLTEFETTLKATTVITLYDDQDKALQINKTTADVISNSALKKLNNYYG